MQSILDVLLDSSGSIMALVAIFAYQIAQLRIKPLPFIPLTLFGLYFLASILLPLLGLLPGFGRELRWSGLIQAVFLSWAAIRLAVYVFVEGPYKLTRGMPLPRVTRDFLLLLFFAISGFVLLRTEGQVNLTSLITTSAVLTMVIGLAVQSTLGNFFASLAIQMERPFSVGDWLVFNGIEGRVVNISWKSTYLLTRDNAQIHIPNSQIDAGVYTNYSRPANGIRASLPIGVEYGASPERLRSAVMEVLDQTSRVLKSPAPQIHLVEYGDFAITYQIRYWFADYADDEALRAQIYNQLWYTLRRHNIKIPFPIRDVQHVHIERRHEESVEREARERLPAKLGRVSVLAPLTDSERGQLASLSRLVYFGAGEDVVRQGEAGSSMFIILDGACEVMGDYGRVASIEAGGYFGEMSLLTGEGRSATVRATCDTTLLQVDKKAFAEILQGNPGIVEELGQVLAERRAKLSQHGQQQPGGDSLNIIRRIRAFFHL